MRTCMKMSCHSSVWYVGEENFCRACGEELHAFPTCPCGSVVDIKAVVRDVKAERPAFCTLCGERWTEQRIGTVLSGSLNRLVDDIKGVLHGDC